jgi:hypothetical protein
MANLELTLTALAETAAVALHFERNSGIFKELSADAEQVGEHSRFHA